MAVNLLEPRDITAVPGVQLFSAACGMRYKERDDLVLMRLSTGSISAGVFTTNKFRAAPVLIAQQHLAESSPRALLINMGNANAGTGDLGAANCMQSCSELARLLGCDVSTIVPFSTGVIGEQMDMKVFTSGLQSLVAPHSECDWLTAAKAIITTDTVAKAASRQVVIDGYPVIVSGMAKGSGMICPNMATMLAFVATDANVSQEVLDSILAKTTDVSFHRISVDSDTSTNDAVMLSATKQAKHALISDLNNSAASDLYTAIEEVMVELAHAIVRDGEGATKFVEVEVNGGSLESDCSSIAYSIAHSPLVKTALNASDPNWGRLLMAIGKAPAQNLDIDRLDLAINGLELLQHGQPHPSYTESAGQIEFQKEEITITVNLNLGAESYTVWTSDLSHDYVSINADYRS